jgi:hypothetical protein
MKTLSIFARGALVASLVSAAAVPQLANGPQDTYCACNQVEKQLQQLQQQLEALNIRTTAQIQALEEKTQRLEHALQLGLRDATAHVPPKDVAPAARKLSGVASFPTAITFGGGGTVGFGSDGTDLEITAGATTLFGELNLDLAAGGVVDTGEFATLDGVTSSIQSQLDGKASTTALSSIQSQLDGLQTQITALGAGGVGTYVFAGKTNSGRFTYGDVYSGNQLKYSGFASTNGYTDNTAATVTGSTLPSGTTWVAMGSAGVNGRINSGLWRRLS